LNRFARVFADLQALHLITREGQGSQATLVLNPIFQQIVRESLYQQADSYQTIFDRYIGILRRAPLLLDNTAPATAQRACHRTYLPLVKALQTTQEDPHAGLEETLNFAGILIGAVFCQLSRRKAPRGTHDSYTSTIRLHLQ